MKIPFVFFNRIEVLLFLYLTAFASVAIAQESAQIPVLIHAARVFDGNNMRTDTSVLVVGGVVAQIDASEAFKSDNIRVIDLGDATLLPGFIELHAHLTYHHIPADVVLKHGITTLREVGGPLHQPYGGDGSLRVLASGPILTAPGGYPSQSLDAENIAITIATEQQARETVRTLVNGGADVIKIALEPGGEVGAPWISGHYTRHKKLNCKAQQPEKPWPLLPENIVKVIVNEAHKLDRKVTAHIGEAKGARIAVDAGVDEWAHMPCAAIPEVLLKRALEQNVTIITTLDTLSKCQGVTHNARVWGALGGDFLYGAEIAHPDIPWGIDAQELIYMMSMTNMQPLDILRSVTSKSGRYLGIPLLGTLQLGAPADMIAVQGNPMQDLKILEYPDFVMSGGKIVLNNFARSSVMF